MYLYHWRYTSSSENVISWSIVCIVVNISWKLMVYRLRNSQFYIISVRNLNCYTMSPKCSFFFWICPHTMTESHAGPLLVLDESRPWFLTMSPPSRESLKTGVCVDEVCNAAGDFVLLSVVGAFWACADDPVADTGLEWHFPSLNKEFNFSYPPASMSTFTLTSLYTEFTFVLTGFSSELKHRWWSFLSQKWSAT